MRHDGDVFIELTLAGINLNPGQAAQLVGGHADTSVQVERNGDCAKARGGSAIWWARPRTGSGKPMPTTT